ncbi:5-methylcytosine restriction system specificity protein McrC [Geodermatophilus sp. SYSU D00079]
MIRRISVREGEPLDVDIETAAAIRRRLSDLEAELRPRLSFSGGGAALSIWNLVGTVQVTPHLLLEIEPKTEPGRDWASSLLDLMRGERASFDGLTPKAELSSQASLPDAFARVYVDQLGKAIRQEGPLLLLRRADVASSLLSGRLQVTSWLRHRTIRPHRFPQQRTMLTADNEFTGALAWVAEALAVRASHPSLRSRLRGLARALRPGLPEHTHVEPNVVAKDVPPQWKAYGPAWATACAVLRRLSPLHRSGVLEGLSLAIEPWPLLETLLHRSLTSAAIQGRAGGLDLHASPHSTHGLLTPVRRSQHQPLSRIHTARSVEPDGLMRRGDAVVATFEAKYSVPNYHRSRDHIFQALTTATAVRAPLAVLIYPEASDPVLWRVTTAGEPRMVAALGLDMYGYARGDGDRMRGSRILKLLQSVDSELSPLPSMDVTWPAVASESAVDYPASSVDRSDH